MYLFKKFDICCLLFNLILTWTRVTINTYWPNNYVDVALSNYDDIHESDDLVLFILHIPFSLCWIIRSIEFCFDMIKLSSPQSNDYETLKSWYGFFVHNLICISIIHFELLHLLLLLQKSFLNVPIIPLKFVMLYTQSILLYF